MEAYGRPRVSDQRNYTFLKISSAGIIGCFYRPDKSACRLLLAIDLPIPAMSIDGGGKQELSPAIINIEVADVFYTYGKAVAFV